jgi:hypothetical protein
MPIDGLSQWIGGLKVGRGGRRNDGVNGNALIWCEDGWDALSRCVRRGGGAWGLLGGVPVLHANSIVESPGRSRKLAVRHAPGRLWRVSSNLGIKRSINIE